MWGTPLDRGNDTVGNFLSPQSAGVVGHEASPCLIKDSVLIGQGEQLEGLGRAI